MALALATHVENHSPSISYNWHQRQKRLTAAAICSRNSTAGTARGLTIEILVCAEEAGSSCSGKPEDGDEAWEVGAAQLELAQAFNAADGALLSVPLASQSNDDHLGSVSMRVFAVKALEAVTAAAVSDAAETSTQMESKCLVPENEAAGGGSAVKVLTQRRDPAMSRAGPSGRGGRLTEIRERRLPEEDLLRSAATDQLYSSKIVGMGPVSVSHRVLRQEVAGASAASRPVSGATKYVCSNSQGRLCHYQSFMLLSACICFHLKTCSCIDLGMHDRSL